MRNSQHITICGKNSVNSLYWLSALPAECLYLPKNSTMLLAQNNLHDACQMLFSTVFFNRALFGAHSTVQTAPSL